LVTAGFIVEGDSEAILLKDPSFISLLASLNISCSKNLIINAEGKTKLYNPNADFNRLEAKASAWIEALESSGAQVIFLLLDFDDSDSCFTQFKSKVFHRPNNIVIIAKQALEAWYLADRQALSVYFGKQIEAVSNPELFLVPVEEIKKLRQLHSEKGKGISNKKSLTRHMLNSGFSLTRAAAHPNCPSATYFLNKLQSLNTP